MFLKERVGVDHEDAAPALPVDGDGTGIYEYVRVCNELQHTPKQVRDSCVCVSQSPCLSVCLCVCALAAGRKLIQSHDDMRVRSQVLHTPVQA